MKNLNGGISPTEEEVKLWMEEANVTEGGEIDQDARYLQTMSAQIYMEKSILFFACSCGYAKCHGLFCTTIPNDK